MTSNTSKDGSAAAVISSTVTTQPTPQTQRTQAQTNQNNSQNDSKTEETIVNPHIYFVIDTTGSMSSYIASLNQVLKQLFRMINILFAGKASIHIIAYKDYCDADIISQCHNNSQIESFVAEQLTASGGGDSPEAAKTALNELYEYMTDTMRKNDINNSIVFVYTDAPPHHKEMHSSQDNIALERSILETKRPGFDWIDICYEFRRYNIPFYTFLSKHINDKTKLFWKLLGNVVQMPDTGMNTITQATIGVLCQIMGCNDEGEYEYAKDFRLLSYKNDRYNEVVTDGKLLKELCKNEDDCNGLLPISQGALNRWIKWDKSAKMAELKELEFVGHVESLDFLSNVLKNLPFRLFKDEIFRNLVFSEFKHIFTIENILCLSYNSVFGKIWRYLCRFREDDRLKVLTDTFGLIITRLDDKQREIMQAWIDESYDSTEEINSIINNHIARIRNEFDTKNNKNNENNSKNSETANETDSKMKEAEGNRAEVIKYVTLDAIDTNLLPTKKELLTISHSLFGDIIHKVQQIMTHLIIVNKGINEEPPMENENDGKDDSKTDENEKIYIGVPCSLPNKHFFALLSHLVVKGTMFTMRPALIMSCIAYLSGNIVLKQRAKEFLIEKRGKWIALNKLTDYPEFISIPFIKLVIRCNKQMIKDSNETILTSDELVFYSNLYKIYRIRQTQPKLFELQIGFEPKLSDIRPDFKKQCLKCKEYRSFTLMLENNECAKCLNGLTCPENKDLARNNERSNKNKYSHLVSCRTCRAIYAVIDIDALNVAPKCHYCRENVPLNDIPVINCSLCKNRWILPNQRYFGGNNSDNKENNKDQSDWLCPCCVENNKQALLQSVNVSFDMLVNLFPSILSKLFEIDLRSANGGNISNNASILKDFFSSMSLFKLYNKYETDIFASIAAIAAKCDTDAATVTAAQEELKSDDIKSDTVDTDTSTKNIEDTVGKLVKQNAKYKGRIIHNVSDLIDNIFKTVNYGQLDDICCLCFETKQLLLLESACGKCENLMCFECLNEWYNQVKPGKIVLPTHLLCPFCKQRPKVATLKKYNKQMCAIVRSEKKIEKNKNKDIVYKLQMSYRDYFGWCVQCYQIKQALQRECLRGNLPELTNFKCSDCRELDLSKINECKKCPGCDVPTVKNDGCNHLECVCGVHWCYQCGKQFDEDFIYDHMEQEHGGIMGENEDPWE